MTAHPQFGDAYEQLALTGAADEAGREILAHLAEGCAECRHQMAHARATVAALGLGAQPVAPGAEVATALRQRLRQESAAAERPLPSHRRRAPSQRTWGRHFALALAASVVLAVIAGGLWGRLRIEGRYFVRLRRARAAARQQAQRESARAARLRAALALLAAPGTRVVPAKLGPAAPRAQAFVNPRRGVVLLGEHIAALPAAKTYEMWLLPAKGSPRPAGLFRPAVNGAVVHLYQGALAGVNGIAVSIEPARGSAVPTGAIVMAIHFSPA